MNLCYYHTDMKVTRKLFIGGQRARAVALLQLFLHGLWSSLSLNRVHYSSPGFAKNGLFSQWPGVTYPTTACPNPTPADKQPFFSAPCDRDPGATGKLFTPAGSNRCQSMMDWLNAQEHCCPKYSKHRNARVLFSVWVQCLQRKWSWRA